MQTLQNVLSKAGTCRNLSCEKSPPALCVFGAQPKCEAQEKQLQCHCVRVAEPRARVAHDCETCGHHQTWISENTAPKASDMVQREQQSSNGRNRKSATSLTLFADACRSVGAIITECVSCTIAASLTQHFRISNMSTKMLAPYANVQVAKRWHFPYRRGNPCMQCVSEPSYPGIKHFGEGKC